MKRREFIIKSIIGTFGIWTISSCAIERGSEESLYPPPFEPITEDEKTMFALIDTVLPGRTSDPEGTPGALEAGALIVLFDKSNPSYQFIPVISSLLNTEAENTFKKSFYELDLNKRTDVLGNVENKLPYISLLIKFIKGAFYANLVNDVGYQYMEYPGANLGYRDKDFSFQREMSGEMTVDGSLP